MNLADMRPALRTAVLHASASTQPGSPRTTPRPSLKTTLRQLTVALARALHQCGWPALVGGALIITALAIVFSATAPLREQVTAVEQQRKQVRLAARTNTAPPLSPRARMQNFYAAFPPRNSLPEALMTLHNVASHNGLHDTRADYRDTPETGTPLVRVRIEIPVTGSYASIRNWIAELLEALPSLTLDGLELRRSDMGKAQLDARVRFQLLLRSTP